MDSLLPASPTGSPLADLSRPEISIIIPARNEEASLGACLDSLVAQSGVRFEIIVVDDGSTDRTRKIAQNVSTVRLISAGLLPDGWTGKNNAVLAGAKEARGAWLLFTDADTVHQPGSLASALAEAKRERADLLSYSPEQIAVTFSERAVLPVIFSELARQYPPHKVREQNSGIVAANGQYILCRSAAYRALGGHQAVSSEILEDVALARLFRGAGYRIYFRYGADAVRTRMYRNWRDLRDGWTKNLALLFPRPERRACKYLFLWLVMWLSLAIALSWKLSAKSSAKSSAFAVAAIAVPVFFALWLFLYRRVRIANFTVANNLLAVAFGLPIFSYLLLRSKRAHADGKISWKGRLYSPAAITKAPSEGQSPESLPRVKDGMIEHGILGTGN